MEEAIQVFLTTPLSFALVNLKPVLPGHVLVCPRRQHRRLTDLSGAELADLFGAVQRVQRLLARHYFGGEAGDAGSLADGSFNVTIQDGPEAGQTVEHVHVHVLPRARRDAEPDAEPGTQGTAVYEGLVTEVGNVGGALWDSAQPQPLGGHRPRPAGAFPDIDEASRTARSAEEMEAEAGLYQRVLAELVR